jgi:hypothetical protein
MTPRACQATPLRVARRISATSRKEDTFCNRSASGTRTPVRVMSAFSTMRSDVLWAMRSASKPGVPRSTTNPLTWSSATSRAHTTTWSAKVALPIQRFAPSITHVSPSRRAVVRMPRAAPGYGSFANALKWSRAHCSNVPAGRPSIRAT